MKPRKKTNNQQKKKRHIMSNETENKLSGMNWGKALERNAHGAGDVEATLIKLRAEMTEYIAKNEMPVARVRDAVATVYTKFPLVKFDLNSLASRAVTELNAPAGSETKIGESVKSFVRGESESFEKGGTGKYHIKRGKDGGVRLVTPQYAEEFKKSQTSKAAKNAPAAAPEAAK